MSVINHGIIKMYILNNAPFKKLIYNLNKILQIYYNNQLQYNPVCILPVIPWLGFEF